jgi:hypothetical protein
MSHKSETFFQNKNLSNTYSSWNDDNFCVHHQIWIKFGAKLRREDDSLRGNNCFDALLKRLTIISFIVF